MSELATIVHLKRIGGTFFAVTPEHENKPIYALFVEVLPFVQNGQYLIISGKVDSAKKKFQNMQIDCFDAETAKAKLAELNELQGNQP